MKKATTIDEIYSVFAPEKFLKPEDEEFYVDLYSKDLINTESISAMMTKDGLFVRRTTNIGLLFLQFIEEN